MSETTLKDIAALLDSGKLSERDLSVLEAQLTKLEQLKERELIQKRFMKFVERVWPSFIGGRHHDRMAAAFERVANGECKRLIINMPPRHTKSEFASYLLPAWFLGKYPGKKVIQTSHTAELAVGFGRKVRNLVDTELYQSIFPELHLQSDSKAAGRWNTSKGGDYFAIGVGGAVTGKGADILIIDDPHSEQEAAMAASNPEVYDKVYEWYTSGPRQRLQPGGAIVIVMTRWAQRDLTGQVIKSSAQRGGEEWEVIEFPAILPSGKPLWPEFWSMEELTALQEELPNSKWQAQYQQNPVGNEAAIVKRDWWKWWEKDEPPSCEYILQTWDTAFEKNQRADYSACTTWGVFNNKEDGTANLILLDTYKKRVEWVELKRDALAQYKMWEPDGLLIEKKATGAPLIYELRSMGIPVQEYTPSRGQDKIARLNSVSDIIASGKVWVPRTRWAEELVDEIAAFPSGEHDDLVDATTLALMRFRSGGFLRLPSDEPEDLKWFKSRRGERYYTV
jgi:predicted phage terminase large subunit-like protein|tara:strand:+ start:705 stop:2225 length:1521 start_codon:yes stop_codon:yes gene_type:complete